jgi:tRNA(Ile)-lysidine synthase
MDLIDLNQFKQLIDGHTDILLGISGGVDSMVLLEWTAKHKLLFKQTFRAMHVDHGINEDSHVWAETVSARCKELGIHCDVVKVSLDGLGNNVEYAARQARYRAFCSSGADALVLAHHANDQCESFMLKIFRGSGVKGLKAMSQKAPCWFDSSITTIRPMLNITRGQIEDWASSYNVVNIVDPSNKDNRYDRNYIRNEIWPVIQDRFEIADINMIRSIDHLAEAWQLTTELADIDLESITMSDGSLDWIKMKSIGYLRIKNVIMRILDKNNIYGFSINHIEQFSKGLLDADMDSRNELNLRGFSMNKLGKRIRFSWTEKRAA